MPRSREQAIQWATTCLTAWAINVRLVRKESALEAAECLTLLTGRLYSIERRETTSGFYYAIRDVSSANRNRHVATR